MYKNEEFNELFHHPHNSALIDAKFISIFNEEGAPAAIQYLNYIGASFLDKDNCEIVGIINECTKEENDKNKKHQLISILSRLSDYVISADITYNEEKQVEEIVIVTTTGEIRVVEFSSLVPEITTYILEITTGAREGKTFGLNYEFCNRFNLPHKVVTGFVYGYSDKSKYIHSWIELEYRGEEYVIDCTLNAMINKEGYYLIQHAEPITKVDNEMIKSDIKNHYEKVINFPFEIYLVYRDLIIEGKDSTNKKLQLTPAS